MQHLGPYLLALGLLFAGLITIVSSKAESDKIAKNYNGRGHKIYANLFGGCLHRTALIIIGIVFVMCSLFVFYGIIWQWVNR